MVVRHPEYVFDILDSQNATPSGGHHPPEGSTSPHQYGVPAPTAGICHQKLRGIAVAGTQKIATLK